MNEDANPWRFEMREYWIIREHCVVCSNGESLEINDQNIAFRFIICKECFRKIAAHAPEINKFINGKPGDG